MLPLTALRAFDFVARYGSFSKAASELNVTRPAVSKQIRQLEDLLGCQIVVRGSRSVTLTETGQQLAMGLQQGFDVIGASFRRAQDEKDRANSIRLLVDRDFASSWLAGHIGEFLVENPGVSIEITAERNGHLRSGEDFSFRIFYGPEGCFQSENLTEEVLCDWVDIPMCTPQYAADHISNGVFDKTARLLVDKNYDVSREWFAQHDMSDASPDIQVSKFNDSSMCLSSALSGSGITIGDSFMAFIALQNGSLIAPFKLGLRSSDRYSICSATQRTPSNVEARFRSWLIGAIDQYQSSVERILLEKGVKIVLAQHHSGQKF